MVFSKRIIFPWPAAAAAAAEAVKEDPLISQKKKLLPCSGDTCSCVPAACHTHRLSAGQIWLQGAEIMGSSFSLTGASERTH